MGHPRALVVAGGDLAVGPDADAVGRAQPGGDDFELVAILINLHQRAGVLGDFAVAPAAAKSLPAAAHRAGLGGVEVAFLVCVQVEDELVEAGRAGDVVVEGLIDIARAVAIEITVARDLVAACGVDHVVHDLEAEGLEAAAGETLPRKLLQFVVNAADNPHVAVPSGERGALAVAEEVQPTEAHAAVPRVRHGRRENVLHVSAVGRAARSEDALRDDGVGPVGRAGLLVVGQRGLAEGEAGELRLGRSLSTPHRDSERRGSRTNRNANAHLPAHGEFEFESLRRADQLGEGRLRGDGVFLVHLLAVLGDLALRLRLRHAQRGAIAIHRRLAALEVTHGKEQLLRVLPELEGPHECRLPVLLHHARLLHNARAKDVIGQRHRHAVDVQRLDASPSARQGAEGFLARVGERAVRVRPTRLHAQTELLLADQLRMPAVRAVESHAPRRDEAAGPTRAPAEQVLVEAHRRVRAEADGDALVRLVFTGEPRADAGLLKWEVVLDDACLRGRGCLPLRFLL